MNDYYNRQGGGTYNPINTEVKKGGSKLVLIINIILIIALALLGYGYYLKQKELKLLSDPTAKTEAVKKAVEDIVAKAGKIALLPKGELPEVLTINDAESAIKQQPSLVGVVNGDNILVYAKASKAVIYSPSRNIIVNVLPIFFQQDKGTDLQPTPNMEEKLNNKTNN